DGVSPVTKSDLQRMDTLFSRQSIVYGSQGKIENMHQTMCPYAVCIVEDRGDGHIPKLLNNYPNLVIFYHWCTDAVHFDADYSEMFIVPYPLPYLGREQLCRPVCTFLTMSIRGEVPPPAI